MNDAPKPEIKKMTILEQLKELDDKRAKLVTTAKDEALKKAEAAIADLNALGFTYRLAEGNEGPHGRKKIQRQADPDKPCSVCNFATVPPHDGRVHRHQEPKKPFTVKELEEKGYKKK